MSLASGMALALCAQRAVAPPPKPTDNGPSLAVTMRFIQDKLNDTGPINYVAFWQNTTDGSTGNNTITIEDTKVVADLNQCRIFYQEKVIRNGEDKGDIGYGFSVREIKNIVVKPYAQYLTESLADSGSPNIITTSTNPPLMALNVNLPPNFKFHHGFNYSFIFKDADTADRVAKALTHAVELCGGGNKDPF